MGRQHALHLFLTIRSGWLCSAALSSRPALEVIDQTQIKSLLIESSDA
jgi:hypothetical protein